MIIRTHKILQPAILSSLCLYMCCSSYILLCMQTFQWYCEGDVNSLTLSSLLTRTMESGKLVENKNGSGKLVENNNGKWKIVNIAIKKQQQ